MSRTEWIRDMIKEGLKKEDIIAAIIKGNAMKGAKPIDGENASKFAELNYKKELKKQAAK